MITGGIGAVALAGGGAMVLTSRLQDFYADMVRHYLASEPIAPGAVEAFAADYATLGEQMDKVKPLMYMQSIVGFTGLDMAMSGQRSYESFIRRVTSAFMLGSTMFHRETQSEPIEYVSLSIACANPFARFN